MSKVKKAKLTDSRIKIWCGYRTMGGAALGGAECNYSCPNYHRVRLLNHTKKHHPGESDILIRGSVAWMLARNMSSRPEEQPISGDAPAPAEPVQQPLQTEHESQMAPEDCPSADVRPTCNENPVMDNEPVASTETTRNEVPSTLSSPVDPPSLSSGNGDSTGQTYEISLACAPAIPTLPARPDCLPSHTAAGQNSAEDNRQTPRPPPTALTMEARLAALEDKNDRILQHVQAVDQKTDRVLQLLEGPKRTSSTATNPERGSQPNPERDSNRNLEQERMFHSCRSVPALQAAADDHLIAVPGQNFLYCDVCVAVEDRQPMTKTGIFKYDLSQGCLFGTRQSLPMLFVCLKAAVKCHFGSERHIQNMLDHSRDHEGEYVQRSKAANLALKGLRKACCTLKSKYQVSAQDLVALEQLRNQAECTLKDKSKSRESPGSSNSAAAVGPNGSSRKARTPKNQVFATNAPDGSSRRRPSPENDPVNDPECSSRKRPSPDNDIRAPEGLSRNTPPPGNSIPAANTREDSSRMSPPPENNIPTDSALDGSRKTPLPESNNFAANANETSSRQTKPPENCIHAAKVSDGSSGQASPQENSIPAINVPESSSRSSLQSENNIPTASVPDGSRKTLTPESNDPAANAHESSSIKTPLPVHKTRAANGPESSSRKRPSPENSMPPANAPGGPSGKTPPPETSMSASITPEDTSRTMPAQESDIPAATVPDSDLLWACLDIVKDEPLDGADLTQAVTSHCSTVKTGRGHLPTNGDAFVPSGTMKAYPLDISDVAMKADPFDASDVTMTGVPSENPVIYPAVNVPIICSPLPGFSLPIIIVASRTVTIGARKRV